MIGYILCDFAIVHHKELNTANNDDNMIVNPEEQRHDNVKPEIMEGEMSVEDNQVTKEMTQSMTWTSGMEPQSEPLTFNQGDHKTIHKD